MTDTISSWCLMQEFVTMFVAVLSIIAMGLLCIRSVYDIVCTFENQQVFKQRMKSLPRDIAKYMDKTPSN